MPQKQEPTSFPDEPADVKGLAFGEWAICPKCRARERVYPCKVCNGKGVVPNIGTIPFTKKVGK